MNRNNNVFTFKAPQAFLRKVKEGDSISVNGACLTVIGKPARNSFSVDVMPETQRKTTFAELKIGDKVNLELPVTPTTFLSGHIVQGHIDGVGRVTKIAKNRNSWLVTIQAPIGLAKYIAEKGSVAVNGVSLTVIGRRNNVFSIGIIPHTWQNTTFHTLKVGSSVNIEVDILAKYVEKLVKQ